MLANWIGGCFFAKNLKIFLRELLLSFFEILAGFAAENRVFGLRLVPVAIYPTLGRFAV